MRVYQKPKSDNLEINLLLKPLNFNGTEVGLTFDIRMSKVKSLTFDICIILIFDI